MGILFQNAGVTGAGPAFGVPGAVERRGDGGAAMAASSGNFFERFGAVPVNGRNAAKLLRKGEAVLLFPGGVRETIPTAQEDKYKLQWPAKSEFVRLAAKYNATIVPFGAVGAAEALSVVASVEDLDRLRTQGPLAPLAQIFPGRDPGAAQAPSFGGPGGVDPKRLEFPPSPLAVPAPAWEFSRMYFYFGKPVLPEDVDVSSDEATDATYVKVKGQVKTASRISSVSATQTHTRI